MFSGQTHLSQPSLFSYFLLEFLISCIINGPQLVLGISLAQDKLFLKTIIDLSGIKELKMKLSAPKTTTWIVAVIAGILGLLGKYYSLPIVSDNAFSFVAFGFVLLTLATFLKGL